MSDSTQTRWTVVLALAAAAAALAAGCSSQGFEGLSSLASPATASSADSDASSDGAFVAAAGTPSRTYRPGRTHPLAAGDRLGTATVVHEGRLLDN